jgi:hypothetical protein
MSTTTSSLASVWAREHFSRGLAEGLAEGEARGLAEGVLLVLQARGLEISAADRARIVEQASLRPASNWLVSSPLAKENFGRGLAEGLAQGEAKGLAEAVILVLQARSVGVTAADRARTAACTDPESLRDWVARAVTVSAVGELFS